MFVNTTDPRFRTWFKSSRSGGQDGCVECSVSVDDSGLVGVADSKASQDAPILRFGRREWRAFVSGVKNNNFS